MADLTPEQQEWYLERFGVRYLSVQDQPLRQSRRVRRARVRGGVRHVNPVDVAVANAQHAMRVGLERHGLNASPL